MVRAIKGTNDQFEIVAGERRWRAAQRAGLHEVPIITVEVTDAEALELAIIENVQRADLNPLEEAMGYQSLIDQYNHSQSDVAKFVGKSRSHVANTLRLLQLPEPVKALINSGQLTAGHARALVGQPNADELARDIVSRGLNVRQVEALTQPKDGKAQAKAGKGKSRKDADTMALERRVSDALGLNVTIEHRGKGGMVHVVVRRPRADGRGAAAVGAEVGSVRVICSPDGAKRNPGRTVPHCAALHAGYDPRRGARHGSLSAQFRSWRHIFLRGHACRPSVLGAHRPHCLAAPRIPHHACASGPSISMPSSSFRDHLHVGHDLAGRRFRFFRALAQDQELVHARCRQRRSSGSAERSRRVRSVATPILGAHDTR